MISRSIAMLALLTKGLRPTKPISFSSGFHPRYHPYLARPPLPFAKRFYCTSDNKQHDKDVLQKLKRIAALRLEYERGGDPFRYPLRIETEKDYNAARAEKERLRQLRREAFILLRRLSKSEQGDQPLRSPREQLRFVSKLEALLEADAAQPRSALSRQERLAVKDALKHFLKVDKYTWRSFWISILVFGDLLGKSLHWLWKETFGTRGKDPDFLKAHKSHSGVE